MALLQKGQNSFFDAVFLFSKAAFGGKLLTKWLFAVAPAMLTSIV